MSRARLLAKKGMFLVPNFFTTLTLFFGFLSLAYSQRGDIYIAASCVYVAMVSDFMDGLLARVTNTQTEFGQEYDSLADMLAFGVAPASLAWHYSMLVGAQNEPFWLVTFVYVFSIAARLARFNALKQYSDTQFFRGLPSPAAAGLVCVIVLTCYQYSPAFETEVMMMSALIFISLCVVSNMGYPSLKKNDFLQKRPVLISVLLLVFFLVVLFDPLVSVLIVMSLYALTGPMITFFRLYLKLPMKLMAIARWGRVIRKRS